HSATQRPPTHNGVVMPHTLLYEPQCSGLSSTAMQAEPQSILAAGQPVSVAAGTSSRETGTSVAVTSIGTGTSIAPTSPTDVSVLAGTSVPASSRAVSSPAPSFYTLPSAVEPSAGKSVLGP